jgi:hypothetical protein
MIRSSNFARILLAVSIGSLGLVASATTAGADQHTSSSHKTDGGSSSLVVSPVLLGASLSHSFTTATSTTPVSAPLSNIDDLTQLGDSLFVVFQNGVGPMGEASTSGNLDSTVVEFTPSGHVLGQWDVAGRVDGMVADPQLHGVIATVNEDGNTSLYVIQPTAATSQQVTHYSYDAGLIHGGGTDAISLVNSQILISASAPGTTLLPAPNATFPAVYVVQLNASTQVAKLTPLFFDEDAATVANAGPTQGTTTNLALTDPDSSTIVPRSAERFGGTYVMNSQGDQQQIFVSGAGTSHQSLSVLSLSQSVDDTAWATSRSGRLYATDSAVNAVDVISGHLSTSIPYTVATPCNANSAPTPCTAANYFASINPSTGAVTPVTLGGTTLSPKGALIFVSGAHKSGRHGRH